MVHQCGVSIVEDKNLNTLKVDELYSSLKSHESILNNVGEQDEERALHVQSMPIGDQHNKRDKGRGLGSFYIMRDRGRGCGRSSDVTQFIDSSKQH